MTGVQVSTDVIASPSWIRRATLVIGVLITLSALAVAALALWPSFLAPGAKTDWIVFGSEACVICAGAIAIFFGLGRYQNAPGMALLCIGGTILGAAAITAITTKGSSFRIGGDKGFSLLPIFAGRTFAALLFGGMAAFTVLSRSPASFKTFFKGLLYGLPVVASAGAFALARGPLAASKIHTAVVLGALAILALLLGTLLCISVHLIVRAFELGRGDSKPTSRPS